MLVAVVGAGSTGIVSIKEMLEEGLDVIGFEKEETVGGLWVCKENRPDVTTCLKTTQVNFSRQRMAVTDFTFGEDIPTHPHGPDMDRYFQAYADHFDLRKHIRFSTTVLSIDFAPLPSPDSTQVLADSERQYRVVYEERGEQKEVIVDKVMLATGLNQIPYQPSVQGLENFNGRVMHSRSFRGGEEFKNQKVIVVGCRASGADIASALAAHDAQVYLSHRRGAIFVPRVWLGKPFDHYLTRRSAILQAWLDHNVMTHISSWLSTQLMYLIQATSFNIKKEWGLASGSVDIRGTVPTISDDLIPLLHAGKAISVPTIDRILPDGTIVFGTFEGQSTPPLELPPGSINAIIFATGYQSSNAKLPLSPAVLSHIVPPPALFPTVDVPPGKWAKADDHHYLYQHAISPTLPSFAVCTTGFAPAGAPMVSDLRAMWTAAHWSGSSQLAPEKERVAEANKDMEWLVSLQKLTNVTAGAMPYDQLFRWASEAGCDLSYLSYFSLSAWRWSWNNPKLSSMILGGPDIGPSYRLRGRKSWEGAEAAIWRANGFPEGKPRRATQDGFRSRMLWVGGSLVCLVAVLSIQGVV